MATNPRLEFEAIKFPEERPADWPFPTWISPMEWEKIHPTLAWNGLVLVDLAFKVHIANPSLPFHQAIFGFVDDEASPARILLRDGSLFVSIDWRTYQKCFVAAAATDIPMQRCIDGIAESSDLITTFSRAIIDAPSNQLLADYLQAAGLLLHFLIEHELSHARAGHFKLVKDRLRDARLIRAMELAADRNGFLNTYLALLRPFIDPAGKSDDVARLAHRFGYALVIFFFSKAPRNGAQVNSKYPSFYERIAMLCGACLVPCLQHENLVHGALLLIKARTVGGAKNAISALAEAGVMTLPKAYEALGQQVTPQRANCVSCSVFARALATEAAPLMREVLDSADEFERYSPTRMGFNRMDFDPSQLVPHGLHYCPIDHPIRYRFEPLLNLLRKARRPPIPRLP